MTLPFFRSGAVWGRLFDTETPTGASPGETTPATPPPAAPAAPPPASAAPAAPSAPAQSAAATPTTPDPTSELAQRLAALETQHTAAQNALKLERTDLAIERAATAANVDPKLVAKLLQVEYDDDGKPTGVDAAVAALVEQYPYLKQSAGPVGAPTSTATPANPAKPNTKKASLDDQVDAEWSKRGRGNRL